MALIRRDAPTATWEFTDPASGDRLQLVPERGGLVTGWRCDGQERLYFDAERFADPALSVRGGIPVLFPICGGLPGEQLPLAQGCFPMPQHGFARNLPWSVAPLADGRGVVMALGDSAASRLHFPFAFQLELELRLEPRALAILARVQHPAVAGGGEAPLPFSLGLHPYFAVRELAALRLEGLPLRCVDQAAMAPADTAAQLEHLAAGVDLLCEASGPVRLLDPLAGSAIELESEAPLDLVVVWTDPPRPMLCLEPWSGPRGSLISGERRLSLAPGDSCELRCRYRILAA
ncbi:MAG: galactose mutarotase [Synechococcaceae cyanobacterium]|nr:galactose mutarotase [Synechococcaceae cyanobacterium]